MKAFQLYGDDIYPDTLVSDAEAIRANLQARLSIIQGEYVKNVNFGIPLGASQDKTDLFVQRIILSTAGVTGISEFTSSITNSVYKCKFVAETIYGGVKYE